MYAISRTTIYILSNFLCYEQLAYIAIAQLAVTIISYIVLAIHLRNS